MNDEQAETFLFRVDKLVGMISYKFHIFGASQAEVVAALAIILSSMFDLEDEESFYELMVEAKKLLNK